MGGIRALALGQLLGRSRSPNKSEPRGGAMYLWRSRNVDGSPLEYGLPYEDLYFVTKEEEPKTLNAWFVKQRGFKHCPTLIFLHGNAGNIGDRLQNVYGLYENVQ